MTRLIGKILREARGATTIEYGLILALIVLVLMAALMEFAATSIELWNNVSEQVVGAR